MSTNDGIEMQGTKSDPELRYRSEFCKSLSRLDGSEPLNFLTLRSTVPDLRGLENHDSANEALRVNPQYSTEAFRTRLNSIADDLCAQQDEIQKSFNKEHDSQGTIGKAFDAAKNCVGTEGERDVQSTPGWLWRNCSIEAPARRQARKL